MVMSVVVPLRRPGSPTGDDVALVQALREGHPAATAELFDRYGGHVQRVLVHVLGYDPELADLLHEVFTRALANVASLNDGSKLKAWLTSIAVFTARGCIRSRTRRRWLGLSPPSQLEGHGAPSVPAEVREAVRCTYEVLDRLSTDERVVFTLRHVHGLELAELAEAMGVSLATVKRRLARAQKRFVALARHAPALAPWLEEGNRWVTER